MRYTCPRGFKINPKKKSDDSATPAILLVNNLSTFMFLWIHHQRGEGGLLLGKGVATICVHTYMNIWNPKNWPKKKYDFK